MSRTASRTEADQQGNQRGRAATKPTEVDAGGWKDIAKRVAAEAKKDHLTLISAGVAFYFLIALIPAIAAAVSIYGLVADPAEVAGQIESFLQAAPTAVQDLVTEQAERVAATSDTAASLSAILSILVALWAASGGCQHLIEAVNAAYDEEDSRGFVKRRGLALAMTLGAIVFLGVAVGTIAVVPALLDGTALGGAAQWAIQIGRWPLLALVVIGALAVLYRYAPDRDEPRWQWVSTGAIVATVVWLLASIGFSIYVQNFGNYNETYGSLGAIIIVMLWLFITALSMVLGAEVNAESEKQTREDTTQGAPEQMGHREALAADTVGAGEDGEGGYTVDHGRDEGDDEPRRSGPGGPGSVSGKRDDRSTVISSGSTGSSDRTNRFQRIESSSGHATDERGGWGAVAVTVAGRAVASFSRRRYA
jgi:membrane protein